MSSNGSEVEHARRMGFALLVAFVFLHSKLAIHADEVIVSNPCHEHAPVLCSGFGTWTYDASTGLGAFEVEFTCESSFSSAAWTMDVHTDRFPDGELRGIFWGPDALKRGTRGAIQALFR